MLNFSGLTLTSENRSDSQVEELGVKDIAIIGMAGRFPGADDTDRLWELVRDGVDGVGPFPQGRFDDVGAYMAAAGLSREESVYRQGAFLHEVDKFDRQFFRISPREASLMNPNQRLFLETAWHAIEDAGYAGERISGSSTGVFIGYNGDAFHDYKRMIDRLDPEAMSIAVTGNLSSMMAGRLSYLLDLKGPALCIDTACSSSLVALHVAVQSLRSRECKMALVGSARVNLLPFDKRIQIGIESADGRAKSFDDGSDGTGAGEGVCALLLKPLVDALSDGDAIHAVIKGSAAGQDGLSVGLTAPNRQAQTDVLRRAWQDAGVPPETISYVEAHGTGTKLGDPIEIAALSEAFSGYTSRRQFCAVGALKSNFGHMDHAAGLAGVIKAVMMLRHRMLPPTLHFQRPNRSIDFIDSPVYVNTALREWIAETEEALRCGVSSFGMSGTNAHVVLEAAPAAEQGPVSVGADPQQGALPFVLSAQTEEALLRLCGRYAEAGDQLRRYALADICYTAAVGRKHMGARLAIAAATVDELLAALGEVAKRGVGGPLPDGVFAGSGEGRGSGADGRHETADRTLAACAAYTRGETPVWRELFRGCRTVHLPGYDFEKTRCWLEAEMLPEDAFRQEAAVALRQTAVHAGDELLGSELERTIASVWREVLGVGELRGDDNYFELGGDSILAQRISNRLSERLHTLVDAAELFRHPTIRELAATLEVLDPADEALTGLLEPQRAERMERYPLSSAQRRIYILQNLEPESVAYHLPLAIQLEGEADDADISAALERVLRRHEVFRASFHLAGDEPYMTFTEEQPELLLETVDMPDASEEETREQIARFIRPFDLRKAPLVRAILIRLSGTRRLLVVDKHHIISDGTSTGLLIGEFMDAYRGLETPPAELAYKDYAVWQNSLLETERLLEQKAYWQQRFQGEIPALQLPTDFARPPFKSSKGRTFEISLAADPSALIKRRAKERNVTLFNYLMAAYSAFLHLYTGQDDIVIGTPVSGRGHRKLERLIGMFVGTLAIRSRPGQLQRFDELLAAMNMETQGAFSNQDYPFEELIHSLGMLDKSRNPLFDTMFILQNIDLPEVELDQLVCRPVTVDTGTSKFDLMIQTFDDKAGLRFVVEYCSDLFLDSTARRMLQHFVHVLEQVAEQPDIVIGHIDLLGGRDTAAIVSGFNRHADDKASYEPIHRMFERHASGHGERAALVWHDETWSYRELNAKANHLANRLAAEGIGRGSIVGLLAERSPELAVGLLGILKTGAAYVPIDPALPTERIAYMLEDSKAPVLLCTARTLPLVPEDEAATRLLEIEPSSSSAGDERGPAADSSADDLMYVIYTSGSTGQPKGVMVEHRNFHNFAQSINRFADGRFSESDRFLNVTSISFDVSVCELFLPFVFGGALVLYPPAKLSDPRHLAGFIVEQSVTFAYLPPTILNEIADCLEPVRDKLQLDKLLVGVESIKDTTLERYKSLRPEMAIINGYGPTETTICSNMHVYESHEPTGVNVPIGRPLHGNRVYILNECLRPAPVGVSGELYVSGEGVARGYFGKPEMTADKFVPDPFHPGGRMYRTGDLAKWRINGEAEYVGRADFQVKIRGYRIEPGEIEIRLLELSGVRKAVVLPVDEADGRKALCAYVVSEAEPLSVQWLRSELQRSLPEYMIPGYFVELADIPVTDNGKVDRKALPQPERSGGAAAYEPPSDPLEEKLAFLWQAVLGVERVGIHDNFFELGGHSLHVIRFELELEKQQIPIGELFVYNHPTIARQAEYFREHVPNALDLIPSEVSDAPEPTAN